MHKIVDGQEVEMSAEEQAEMQATWDALQAASVPSSITIVQAQLQLLDDGSLDQVDAYMAGLAGDVGQRARIEWTRGSVVLRSGTLAQHIAAAVGWNAAELDGFFTAAAGR